MKKIISVFLALAMIFALGACGKSAPAESEAPLTAAGTILADFKAKMESGKAYTAEELADALVTAENIPFAGASMAVEPGYLNGFTDEINGFESGAVFAPMIGSIPFVGYVFVLADGVSTADFISMLESKADLRWNICTEADEMASAAVGQTVCFIMSPLSFDD